MAISLDEGYTVPVTTKNLAINDIDYSHWAVESQKTSSGDSKRVEVTYVNSTSPIDRPAKLTVFREKIKDVYSGTTINTINQAPLKEGVRLGWNFTHISDRTDSDCPCQHTYLPRSLTITYRTALSSSIGATQLLADLKEALGVAFPTGSVTTNQLANWLAGAITSQLDETPSP